MKSIIIIPARWNSKRFPGKPLAKINNKELIFHVWERAILSKQADLCIVATDDKRIKKFCENNDIKVIMTSKKHFTGTDRVHEVARKIKSDIYVNLQGDEPLIDPKNIDKIILNLKKNIKTKFEISTGYSLIKTGQNKNKSIVFLSKTSEGELKFLTRSENYIKDIKKLKHIGIFAFTKDGLKKFAKFKLKLLEKKENIELLRSVENNQKVFCVKLNDNNVSVDYPSDIEKVEKQIKNQ